MANQTAEFSRIDGVDYVEIRTIGDPCSFIGKVTPAFIAMFPREWEAFVAGTTEVDYGGTPLSEIPTFSPQLVTAYKLKGIHNCEMLAEASDAAISALGMGGIEARKMARLVIRAAGNAEPVEAPKRGPGRPRKAAADPLPPSAPETVDEAA